MRADRSGGLVYLVKEGYADASALGVDKARKGATCRGSPVCTLRPGQAPNAMARDPGCATPNLHTPHPCCVLCPAHPTWRLGGSGSEPGALARQVRPASPCRRDRRGGCPCQARWPRRRTLTTLRMEVPTTTRTGVAAIVRSVARRSQGGTPSPKFLGLGSRHAEDHSGNDVRGTSPPRFPPQHNILDTLLPSPRRQRVPTISRSQQRIGRSPARAVLAGLWAMHRCIASLGGQTLNPPFSLPPRLPSPPSALRPSPWLVTGESRRVLQNDTAAPRWWGTPDRVIMTVGFAVCHRVAEPTEGEGLRHPTTGLRAAGRGAVFAWSPAGHCHPCHERASSRGQAGPDFHLLRISPEGPCRHSSNFHSSCCWTPGAVWVVQYIRLHSCCARRKQISSTVVCAVYFACGAKNWRAAKPTRKRTEEWDR